MQVINTENGPMFELGLPKDSRGRCGETNNKKHYFNIEKVNSPYLIKYIEVDITEVSSNFTILPHGINNFPYVVQSGHNGTHYFVIVVDLKKLTDTLKSYKELLLKDKNRSIVDHDLLVEQLFWTRNDALLEAGLYINKNQEIKLKRKPRAKPKHSSGEPKACQSEINDNFECLLAKATIVKLGFKIRIKITKNNIYNILLAFKKLFSDSSYEELLNLKSDEYCWTMPSIKECEEFWNDPELAKPKPKRPKKEKKNDQEEI